MKLPGELRLHIYSYLIPNNEVAPRFRLPEAMRAEDTRCTLRSDTNPCCPAILRANKQIYKEVVNMWYTSVTYCMLIRDGRISFLGADNYHMKSQLPPTIRKIRSLKLCITFKRWHRQARGHGPWPSCTKLLAKSMTPGSYELRNLELQISGSSDEARSFFGHDNCNTDLLRADLEWNLAPLRALRGVKLTYRELLLGSLRDDIDRSNSSLKKSLSQMESKAILEQQRTLEKAIKKFMEELAGEIA
jgi:hypothetical protein